MMRGLRPPVRLLAAGALFSLGGALIKSCQFPALERSGLRSAIAAVALFLFLPEARRWPSARALLLLPAYFGATCGFVLANSYTTAASAIFLQSTAPLWVTLLGPLLLGEKPRRADLFVLGAIVLGMTLCFLAPSASSASAPDPRLGNVLALVSGLSYGLVLLGFRWLGRHGEGEAAGTIAWGNLLGAPLAFALMPFFGQRFTASDAGSWLAILVLGVFQVALAYAWVVRAMPHVPAVQASLILMIEPALNPLLAFLVHGERPHALVLAGGALIVGAVAAGSFPSSRARS
jgi:drug/metabolite transporter (DMT)-like permease